MLVVVVVAALHLNLMMVILTFDLSRFRCIVLLEMLVVVILLLLPVFVVELVDCIAGLPVRL